MRDYFDKLRETQGIELSAEQKAWYVKKAGTQLSDMKREYPSTPEEAFEASLEGAYYADQLAAAELQGRVGELPCRARRAGRHSLGHRHWRLYLDLVFPTPRPTASGLCITCKTAAKAYRITSASCHGSALCMAGLWASFTGRMTAACANGAAVNPHRAVPDSDASNIRT